MSSTDYLFAQQAVERIGELEETFLFKHSSIHFGKCGGCGGPAYQQPCAICNFYPYGSDKGHFWPAVATYEHFKKSVDRSVKDQEPNLATWYFSTKYERVQVMQFILPEMLVEAAKLDMPSARTVWDVVVVDGRQIHREYPDRHIAAGWRGIEELIFLRTQREMNSVLSQDIDKVAKKWVAAVHDGDLQAVTDALEAAQDVLQNRCRHIMIGNKGMALRFVEEAFDHLPSRTLSL